MGRILFIATLAIIGAAFAAVAAVWLVEILRLAGTWP